MPSAHSPAWRTLRRRISGAIARVEGHAWVEINRASSKPLEHLLGRSPETRYYFPSTRSAKSGWLPLPSTPDREYPDPQNTVPPTTAGPALTDDPALHRHRICPV